MILKPEASVFDRNTYKSYQMGQISKGTSSQILGRVNGQSRNCLSKPLLLLINQITLRIVFLSKLPKFWSEPCRGNLTLSPTFGLKMKKH